MLLKYIYHLISKSSRDVANTFVVKASKSCFVLMMIFRSWFLAAFWFEEVEGNGVGTTNTTTSPPIWARQPLTVEGNFLLSNLRAYRILLRVGVNEQFTKKGGGLRSWLEELEEEGENDYLQAFNISVTRSRRQSLKIIFRLSGREEFVRPIRWAIEMSAGLRFNLVCLLSRSWTTSLQFSVGAAIGRFGPEMAGLDPRIGL